MYSHKKHNCAHAAVNEHTFTNDIWSWRHWQRFVEERFEKDVFFCYTVAHDNIPFNWKAIYTSFAKILWFVVAIYFTLTFYFTDQGSSYVSLSKHPGCTEVPIPINNVYTLDLSGFWNGQQGHVESESFVRVRLSELTTTLEEFDTLMIGVAQIILAEAALSTSRDLAGNLASMMAWQRDFYRLNSEGVYTKHIIEFTADVSHVFDRFYKVGVLSNVDADCDVHMPVTYDRSTARMTATIAEAEFESSSKCQQAIEPAQLGYSGYASGPTISVGVDLHSLTIAYGISSGSVTMESFTLIVDPLFGDFDVYYGDDEYHLQIGIDEKFPGMDPVYCLLPDQRHNESSTYLFETLCVIKVFDQYVYPFFNHGGLAYHPSHGFDANTPLMCKCSDGTGFMEPCSDLDFFVGFLMFNKSSVSETFHEILNMVYANSPADINTFTYNASFAAHRLGGRASTHPPPGAEDGDPAALAQLSDPEWRRQTYAFCNNCSMFTLHVFDDLNYRVNAQGLQVFNGSCNDIITPQADWTNIEPPSKTIEDFFKCKPDEFDSLLNGLGIGVGDATIVVPTLIILSIPLLHLLAVFCLSEDRKREERHRFAALHEGVHGMYACVSVCLCFTAFFTFHFLLQCQVQVQLQVWMSQFRARVGRLVVTALCTPAGWKTSARTTTTTTVIITLVTIGLRLRRRRRLKPRRRRT